TLRYRDASSADNEMTSIALVRSVPGCWAKATGCPAANSRVKTRPKTAPSHNPWLLVEGPVILILALWPILRLQFLSFTKSRLFFAWANILLVGRNDGTSDPSANPLYSLRPARSASRVVLSLSNNGMLPVGCLFFRTAGQINFEKCKAIWSSVMA